MREPTQPPMPALGELIDQIQRIQIDLSDARRRRGELDREINRLECSLVNTQNDFGKALRATGVVGGDYALVDVELTRGSVEA